MTSAGARWQRVAGVDEARRWSWLLLWLPLATLVGGIAARLVVGFHKRPYVIFDDQVQHIVPFRHYLPGSVLPRDHIIDYYLTENSFFYDWLYAVPAMAGVEPVLTAAVIAVGCGVASLVAVHALMRSAGGSFAASAATVIVLLTVLAGRDDIAIGSARSMGWPLLVAALWTVVAARTGHFAVFGVLAALIYPPVAVIALGSAGLYLLSLAVEQRSLRAFWRWVPALAAPFAILVISSMGGDDWGPTITENLSRTLPEFGPRGRSEYFVADPLNFYLFASRSALIDARFIHIWFLAPLAIAGIFLSPDRRLLRLALALALTSCGLWLLAHLTLYALYLPARFPSYGLVLAAVLMAGSALGSIASRLRFGPLVVGAFLIVAPLHLVANRGFGKFSMTAPRAPLLHDRIKQSAGDGKVGGVSVELNFVTAVTGRPVLWSRETALPYKLRYRAEVARQLVEASTAVLSSEPDALLRWVGKNSIDWVLVDDEVFQKGGTAALIARTPGGSVVASRFPGPTASWLAQQDDCAIRQGVTRLFDAACLGRAASRMPIGTELPAGP